MSWQDIQSKLQTSATNIPLRSSSLIGTGHVDQAAIFNAEGTSVWATSPNFNITPQELQEVVGAYKDTSVPKQVQTKGLHIAGKKYFVIKADDTSLYGKLVGFSSLCPFPSPLVFACHLFRDSHQKAEPVGQFRSNLYSRNKIEMRYTNTFTVQQGREGVVIVKTKQALLITHYPETVQPGTAANTVEKLGAYLVSVGY
ncbi:profilin, required for normal timing of actin polymerization in response to thermal stress [Exophiala dermatitidis]|nr:profilin, required for normal timing of actin polymerization in response to thermal stress [Exophiala dermatitidis]